MHSPSTTLRKPERKELLRLMPKNSKDILGAKKLVKLGAKIINPIYKDMIQRMHVADSPVADCFAKHFSNSEEDSLHAISNGLLTENCWLRHRLFTEVFPYWKTSSLAKITNSLTIIATQPDAYHNDLYCIKLLTLRQLSDQDWLKDWLKFKRQEVNDRRKFIKELTSLIRANKSS